MDRGSQGLRGPAAPPRLSTDGKDSAAARILGGLGGLLLRSASVTGPNLRILILSTPKTGSTWLRSLLSGIYRLPQLYLEPGFDCESLNRGGGRWVAQYHIRPHAELSAWIRAQRAIAITTIRHPADVLISLFHHLREFRAQSLDLDFVRRMLSADFERTNITTDSKGPFWADLECSLDWMSEAGTEVVRYEDLRSDPLGALRELASRISAVPDERIEAAIEMSDLALMRAMAGSFGGFFREGRIGAWRDLLPPDVIEVFRSMPPYAAQMVALGYSMDPADPTITCTVPSRQRHPMAALDRFENGVAVVPIITQCFFWARADQRAHWQEQLAATGPSSFFDWLNLPCEPPGLGLYEELPLTNLAAFVYGQRPDVRMAHPALTAGGRYEYARWFVRHAAAEYGLDRVFVDSADAGLLRWANTPCARDGAGIYAGLPIPNLAAHLYDQRADLRLAYPDLAGSDRYEYVQWLLRHAESTFDCGRTIAYSLRDGLMRWANTPCMPAGSGIYAGLPVPNLAAYLYDQRTDLRLAYPDLTGSDRYEYIQWFLRAVQTDRGFVAECIHPVRSALLRWADATAEINGGAATTNFVLHICRTRTDVLGSFPHIRGQERRILVRSVIRAAKALGMDAEYVTPLEKSLGRHWLPRSIRTRILSRLRLGRAFPRDVP
jgi:Sulfotransferase domain